MSPAGDQSLPPEIPVFFLKTKSSPSDSYEELFSTPRDDAVFKPQFVPVLQHYFESQGVARVTELLRDKKIGVQSECSYGGLIFTSQRAVEAFAQVIQDGKGSPSWPHLQDVPVYSVGPATTKALRAASPDQPLQIFGEHTGNGANLGQFILGHYKEWYKGRSKWPPLLMLVGEQRTDSVPKALMDERLPLDQRIHLDELVVYKTGVMESFRDDFDAILDATKDCSSRWVVVFSPTGCDAMMSELGLLDKQTGKAKNEPPPPRRRTMIATIGPTTRNHLRKTFDFEPDVCAAKPSPEGVLDGITQFLKR